MRKVWAILAGVGAVLLGVLKVFSMGQQSKANEISAETSQREKEISDDAHLEIIAGQKKQQEIRDEERDPDRDRDILS